MADLDTDMYLNMLQQARTTQPGSSHQSWIYGLHWGDPDINPGLRSVVDRFITPNVSAETTCVEIGPGGGRWTRYLTGAQRLYAVDFHQEFLNELARNFSAPNITPIKNAGTNFPGVPRASVDFVFSFGLFVHLDLDLIEDYLRNMQAILKPTAKVFIQYADKTSLEGKANRAFAVNTPTIMRALVEAMGYRILDEDTVTLPHSAMILFTPDERPQLR